MPKGSSRRPSQAWVMEGWALLFADQGRPGRAARASTRVLEKRRGAAVWAKIWRRSERRLKFRVRDGGDSVLTITRWLKAARARAGHSPPAIWAMAKRGRQ